MSDYYRFYWMCPYYRANEKKTVRCEGGRIALPGAAAAEEYFRTYCSDLNGWRRCTVARAITRHYEGMEEE